MATAFETFVQTELPLRPFLLTDGAQETVFIRRGAGPRQMDLVNINEGEFLTKIGGLLTSGPASGGSSITSTVFNQPTASATWNINHANGSEDFVFVIFDASGNFIFADNVGIVDANNVTVTFSSPQDGKAILIFTS